MTNDETIGRDCHICGNGNENEIVLMGNEDAQRMNNKYADFQGKSFVLIKVPAVCKVGCGCMKGTSAKRLAYYKGMQALVLDIPVALFCAFVILSWDATITPSIAQINPGGPMAAILISTMIHFLVDILAIGMCFTTGAFYPISLATAFGLTIYLWRF